MDSTTIDSDRNGSIDYYEADLTAATSCYSYGAVARSFNADSIRYAFNGQRRSFEISNTAQTALYWEYDGDVGRRWNLDPLASKFPWQSPYCTMDGNPILKNDLNGESGEVTIDKQSKTITINAKLIFHGEASNQALAKQTAADIQNLWNGAKGKAVIGGIEYNVQFNITGEHRNTNGFVNSVKFLFEKYFNKDVKNNFIEIKNKVDGGVSNMIVGGNEGTFQLDNINGSGTTTEAHEFGHSLGLWPGTTDSHPSNDQRGKGQPGIMSARGTAVDADYTYNPAFGPTKIDAKGKRTNTIDPKKRKVLQSEIDGLGLDKLDYNNNKANLGQITNNK